MITFFFFSILITIAQFLLTPLSALPDVAAPQWFLDGVSLASTWLSATWQIFPNAITTLLVVIVFLVALELKVFGYKVIIRIKKIFWAG